MKRIFLILLFTTSGTIFSQEFELTKDNFVNKDDVTKNYIVIEIPNTTQKQLFEKSKIFIQSTYKNLKGDGLNEVEDSFIKLQVREPGTKVKILGSESLMSYSVSTYELHFKEGKVMVKPYLNEFVSNENLLEKTYLTGGNSFAGKSIFNKEGKIWLKNYYEVANNNANGFLKKIKEYLLTNQDW